MLIRGGKYTLIERIRVAHSGTPDAWITFKGYPGEFAVIDAFDINVGSPGIGTQFPHDDGALQIEGVRHIRVENLDVRNSRGAGITVRDSSYVDIIGNHVENTCSSGISVWDTSHDALGTAYIRVLSNTVTRANTFAMLPRGHSAQKEAPHEAISIGGATDFEVAYNHVYDVNKEGIDVKEVSRRASRSPPAPHPCRDADGWAGRGRGAARRQRHGNHDAAGWQQPGEFSALLHASSV